MIDFSLGVRLRRLVGNLMIGAVLVTTAIGLTQFTVLVPQPGAAPEFSGPAGSGVIVHSEVVHVWLHGTLVDLTRSEFPARVAHSHHELKEALERRRQSKLWYAITVRAHLADHRVEDTSFIRHPYLQPEHLQELLDILASVAGNPPRHSSADYSAAVVHILPAGMSQREWIEAQPASTGPHLAIPDKPDRKE